MGAIVNFRDNQLALIRKTVAKDCDAAEFDWAMEICRATKLDPLRRQIYFFVFNKDDAKKRQMVPVVAIGGYRSMAERTGNYRPGKTQTITDETLVDPLCNPLGVSHAVATVYKYIHGDWHEIQEAAYWDEFAPIVETGEGGFEWVDSGFKYPDGHAKAGKPKMRKVPIGDTVRKLDPTKDGWRKMPRVMIEKCAEAKALRRAWPDDFAGLYVEGETDRAEALELTPSEMADAADVTKRLEVVGGMNRILIDWTDGEPLQSVPVGKLGDAVLQFIRENDAARVALWEDRNRHGLNEYWARDKDGCLTVKKEIEKKKSEPVAAE